jgi:hypothetical protein
MSRSKISIFIAGGRVNGNLNAKRPGNQMKIQCINMGRVWSFANVLVRLLLLAAGSVTVYAGPGPVDSDVVFSNCLTEKTGSYTFSNPTGRLPEDFEFYFVCTNDDAGSGIRKGQVVAPNSFFCMDPTRRPIWTYFFNGTSSVTIYCPNWTPETGAIKTSGPSELQLDQINIASLKHPKGVSWSIPTCISNFVLVARWAAKAQPASKDVVFSNAMGNFPGSCSFPNLTGKIPRFFEFYLLCTNDDPADHLVKGQVASPNSFYDAPGVLPPRTWYYAFDGTNGITLFQPNEPQDTILVISPSHPNPLKIRNLASLDNFILVARMVTDDGGVIASNSLTHNDGIYTFPNPTGHVPRNFVYYFVCTNDDQDSGYKTGQVFSPNCFTGAGQPVDWSYSFDGTNSVTIICPQFNNEAVITPNSDLSTVEIVNPWDNDPLRHPYQTSLTNFVLVARWE